MTARQIASHRYNEVERHPPSATNVQIELAIEYRKLLVDDPEARAKFGSYVKLVPPLLECQSAYLLFIHGNGAREVARHDQSASTSTLGLQFRQYIGDEATVVVNDLSKERQNASMAWTRDSLDVVSFISSTIKISDLELCLLVATDNRPRSWTAHDLERVKDVSQMLIANLELTRERHAISVQRRMQRSLVQFVRGNLDTMEQYKDHAGMQHRTGSLYSDLDEDLEADDADDETEPFETSRMNVMFDFSARLIRRTLKISGCVLVDIENLTGLENIQADIPCRSSIMGACFLKHLRSKDWHESRSNETSSGPQTRSTLSAESAELQTTNVDRSDVFDPRGLSGAWLRQLLETHPRAVAFHEESLPEAIVTLLPEGVQSCLLSPIYDSNARAFALIIAFDDKPGNFTKVDEHYIEAFGSSIYAEVLNQSLQKANEAKAMFISKISHEFRTPLHGVLASAEFLNDMAETTPAQIGFIQTIDTCGRTLLDIINHILDYSKLSFSKNVLPPSASSDNPIAFEDFDVVEVAEEVLSAAFSSYEFKKINEHIDVQKSNSQHSHQSDSDSGNMWEALGRNLEVIVCAESRPQGYLVHSDLGAFRRIVLNLLGNALKYTHSGHVILELKLSATSSSGLEDLRIHVSDTGVGISTSFLVEMFRPFSQEDEFSAGTGLGLSIVKELSTKLHGTIEVESKKRKGSNFTVTYPVMTRKAPATLFPGAGFRRDLETIKFNFHVADESLYSDKSNCDVKATSLLRSSTIRLLKDWYGMEEVSLSEADIMLTDDVTRELDADAVSAFTGPCLTLCSTTAKYEKSMRRRSSPLQVFVTKPCGPNKLGLWMAECLNTARNLSRLSENLGGPVSPESRNDYPEDHPRSISFALPSQESPPLSVSSTVRPDGANTRPRLNVTGGTRRTIREEQEEQNLADMLSMQSLRSSSRDSDPAVPKADAYGGREPAWPTDITASVTHPIPPITKDDQMKHKKHVLIVEDNTVNMMLLVAFAKRHGITVTTAVNGAIAVQRVKERAHNFDAILMDINMPVLNGFDAIAAIRKLEKQSRDSSAKIVALTGLSTPQDKERVHAVGGDAFFTKPVKMAELKELLQEWGLVFVPDISTTASVGSSD